MYNLKDMKTQILVVEPYDNLASLLDKIANAEAPRVILTMEALPGWMGDPTSIRLIARKAVGEGKQVGITLPDLGVRNIYEDAGIQAFEDLTSAQHDRWKDISPVRFIPNPGEKRKKPQDLSDRTVSAAQSLGVKIGLSILAFLSILAILAVYIPKANVTISLKKSTTLLEVPVEVSPQFSIVSLTGSIPAKIRTFNESNITTIPVSTRSMFPQSFATGEVVFSNLTNLEQAIPSGIQLSTASDPSVLFITQASSRLEGKSGAEVVVPVEALEAGESGNVSAGEITRINSILGTQIVVRNDLPIEGGTSAMVSVPGPIDRNSVRAQALQGSRSQTLKDAQASLLANEILVEQSYRVARTVLEKYYPESGKPGETISLEMAVETQVLVLKSDELAQYFNQVIGLSTANDETSIPVDGESLQLTCNSTGVLDQFSCTITGTKQTVKELSVHELRPFLWGRGQNQVRNILMDKYPQISEVTIDQYPSDWPWLPFLPNRLTVELH